MRTPLLLLVALCLCTGVYGKKNTTASSHTSSLERVSLFNGYLQLDMPDNMQKDREYFHYWDNCPQGGYSVSFKSACSGSVGMNVQINLHDVTEGQTHAHDGYDPHRHCFKNAVVLEDTTYMSGGRQYTVVATLAKAGRKNSPKTNNYNLSYYIYSGGRMLEFHYNYWAKDAGGLNHWKDMSFKIANSISWQSNGWQVASK